MACAEFGRLKIARYYYVYEPKWFVKIINSDKRCDLDAIFNSYNEKLIAEGNKILLKIGKILKKEPYVKNNNDENEFIRITNTYDGNYYNRYLIGSIRECYKEFCVTFFLYIEWGIYTGHGRIDGAIEVTYDGEPVYDTFNGWSYYSRWLDNRELKRAEKIVEKTEKKFEKLLERLISRKKFSRFILEGIFSNGETIYGRVL